MNSTDELRMQRADAVFALAPVIPVITIDDLEDALPMARALVDNGLKVLEVTLRTPVALDAIERIATEVPDACVGAGTVLDLVGLKASIRAGARFAISPGATEALYDTAQYADIPLIPGIATASELMRGCSVSGGSAIPSRSTSGFGPATRDSSRSTPPLAASGTPFRVAPAPWTAKKTALVTKSRSTATSTNTSHRAVSTKLMMICRR